MAGIQTPDNRLSSLTVQLALATNSVQPTTVLSAGFTVGDQAYRVNFFSD